MYRIVHNNAIRQPGILLQTKTAIDNAVIYIKQKREG